VEVEDRKQQPWLFEEVAKLEAKVVQLQAKT
jgi:hypothetical protein